MATRVPKRILSLLMLVLAVPAGALDVAVGDLLTRTARLNPATGDLDAMAPVSPIAVDVVAGDYYVLDLAGTTTAGPLSSKLWRYSPDTGRHDLIAVTGIPANVVNGRNEAVKGAGDEIYVFDADDIVAINIVTGAVRSVPLGVSGARHMTVAPNGNIVVTNTFLNSGSIRIITPDGDVVADVGAPDTGVDGVVTTEAGTVVGIVPKGNIAAPVADLVSIDPETGDTGFIAQIEGIGANSFMELTQTPSGDFWVLATGGSLDDAVYRIDGTTFALTQVPLPAGLDVASNSDITVDRNGGILLIMQDDRVQSGNYVMFRLDPNSFAVEFALGTALFGQWQALGSRADLFSTHNDDRVLRRDLKTGTVTLVTSEDVDGAVLQRSGPIAVNGNDIYVVERGSGSFGVASLVHVDATTGVQTELTDIGGFIFSAGGAIVFDDATGDVFYTGRSPNINDAGLVGRVTPAVGAVPVTITEGQMLFDGRGIVVDTDGSLLISNQTGNDGTAGVYRVDRTTGAQSIVSEDALFDIPAGIDLLPGGDVVVADNERVLRVDGAGAVTVLAPVAGGATPDEENTLQVQEPLVRVDSDNLPVPGPIVSSVLPGSRAVQVGTAASLFATIINAGSATATGCAIAPSTALDATFSYQTTDPATNAPIGSPDTPVSIAAGGFQTFVLVFTPTAAFSATTVELAFDCTNTDPAPVFPGVNTVDLLASDTPVADVIALAATASADGIARIPGDDGAVAFAVATANVGAGASIVVSTDTGTAVLPVGVTVCETDPVTAACIDPPAMSVTTDIAGGATPTFSFFVSGSGTVASDPANTRIFVRFSSGADVVGATSVAVQTD